MMELSEQSVPGIRFSAARIARNTLARLATAVIGQGSKGIVAIVVARELGAAAFGTFSVVWTVSSIASYYGAFGIDKVMIRELARRSPLIDLRRAAPVVSSLGLVIAAVLVAGAFAFTDGPVTALAFTAAAPYVALTAPMLVLSATFNARERMEFESLVETIEGAVALTAALLALAFGGGIIGVLAALSLGRCAGLIAALLVHRRLPQLPMTPGDVDWGRVGRASLPMAGVRLFASAYQRSDIIVLGLFVSATQVGLYSAAAVAVLLVVDALSEMGRAAYPALSRASGSEDPEFRHSLGMLWKAELYLALAATAGLIALATPLASGIFGAEFVSTGPLLAVMSITLVLRVLGNLGGISLYAVDRQVDRLRAIAVAAIVKVAMLFALVPSLGLWGAVAASVVADVVFVVGVLLSIRTYRPGLLVGWLPALTIAALVGGAARMTPGHLLVRMGVGAIVFFGLVASTSGRSLLGMFRNTATAADMPESIQIGPIAVRLTGHADRSRSVIARSMAQLPPASGDAISEMTVHFAEGVLTDGVRVWGYPLFSAPGSLYAVDHSGRGAHLPLAAVGSEPIVVDPYLETDVFQSWIQLPVLRLMLHGHGWCLARLTVVELHGRRIALVASATTGKTRVALELVKRGAAMVGDDWVALGPGGVAAACSLVVVRDQARAAHGRLRLADRFRRQVVRLLAFSARRSQSWRKLALALHQAQSLAWRWGTDVVDVETLLPGSAIATGVAPLDLIVMLDGGRTPSVVPTPRDLAEIIASRAIVDLPSATAMEAIYRSGNPNDLQVVFPSIDDEIPLIADVIRHAHIEVMAIDDSLEAVGRVASQIERWSHAPPVSAVDR